MHLKLAKSPKLRRFLLRFVSALVYLYEVIEAFNLQVIFLWHTCNCVMQDSIEKTHAKLNQLANNITCSHLYTHLILEPYVYCWVHSVLYVSPEILYFSVHPNAGV